MKTLATLLILLAATGFAPPLGAAQIQTQTAAAPEPTTLALLGAGLFSLAATRRQTKN